MKRNEDLRGPMKRDLGRCSMNRYDLLIIGGGIYGACAAWDATLRGLSVALVEQGDFGHATSAKTQKIVHGGLRYLQTFDFTRMRQSLCERRTLLNIAAHLVHPMPFLMPLYRNDGLRSRPVMAAALLLNDLVACDRNRGLKDPQQRLPRSRIISRRDCLRLIPGLPEQGVTGGALWYDAQMHNSERLTLSFVLSAAEAGADVANYVTVTGLLRQGDRISGVQAVDALTGRSLAIQSRVVLNATGPWVGRMWNSGDGFRHAQPLRFLKAMNLVTRSVSPQGIALGVASRRQNQPTGRGLLFITPWRGHSIVGTAYAPHDGEPGHCPVSDEEIRALIEDVNLAYPAARLTRDDVVSVQVGLVPAADGTRGTLMRYRILDHDRLDGLKGLISVIGVKYTTARDVAKRCVDVVFKKLDRRPPRSLSHATPLYGGHVGSFDRFLDEACAERLWDLSAPVIRHVVYSYGSCYLDVLRLIRENLAWGETVAGSSEVLKAEVIYSVRNELAVTLADVIFRRTDLGTLGDPGRACLEECAALMAAELGWDDARREREITGVQAAFASRGVSRRSPLADATPQPVGAAG